ncbi:MAG: hypothetical protein NTX72_04925 [Candidatus Uhrbacteria bacterium]|nr:hypothetical protein [Candidatus Uhrbacteria bacterium]
MLHKQGLDFEHHFRLADTWCAKQSENVYARSRRQWSLPVLTNILLGLLCFLLSQLCGYTLNKDAVDLIEKTAKGEEITSLVFIQKTGYYMMLPTYAALGMIGLMVGNKQYKK